MYGGQFFKFITGKPTLDLKLSLQWNCYWRTLYFIDMVYKTFSFVKLYLGKLNVSSTLSIKFSLWLNYDSETELSYRQFNLKLYF